MNIRSKTFLLFFALGLLPASILSAVLYLHGKRVTTQSLHDKAQAKVVGIEKKIRTSLQQHQNEIISLSLSYKLCQLVIQHQKPDSICTDPYSYSLPANVSSDYKKIYEDVKDELDRIIKNEKSHFVSASIVIRNNSEILFSAKSNDPNINSNYKDYLDENVWNSKENKPLPSKLKREGFNTFLYFTVPIFYSEPNPNSPYGVLVVVLKLDKLLDEIGSLENDIRTQNYTANTNTSNFTVVLDNQNNILYHTNQSLRYQSANTALSSSFEKISDAAQREKKGWRFVDLNNESWLVAYCSIEEMGLSVVVGENYSIAVQDWNQIIVIGFLLTFLSGTVASLLIWRVVGKHTRNLERVVKETEEIAEGKNLDKNATELSSEDLQSLGVSINIIKEQLREQLKHQAETEQFQTFTRLTAMLTHDLKNSIAALSMLVNSMEEHFDNEAFREDAMKSLRGIAVELQTLLEKLNQPVLTLSGEFKPPKPNDLVPIIKRVVANTVQNSKHEIEMNLPESLMVKINPEKIEKVIENLVINALEAMNKTKGKVTIEAKRLNEKESFFSVSDTGVGMSESFQKEKLFRPFSTTKKKGFGLGLYSCHEIVIAQGGKIDVKSKQNFGTTFNVVLPSA